MNNTAVKIAGRTTSDAIIRRHDRLIRFMAQPFVTRGIQLQDLMQEGRIALLQAISTYRESEGVKLWTYARIAVFGAIVRFANNEQSEPCRLADHDVSDERGSDDYVSQERRLETAECIAIMADELVNLKEIERKVLRLRFDCGLDVRQIAEQLNVSKSEIDRIYHRALAAMRERVGAKL